MSLLDDAKRALTTIAKANAAANAARVALVFFVLAEISRSRR